MEKAWQQEARSGNNNNNKNIVSINKDQPCAVFADHSKFSLFPLLCSATRAAVAISLADGLPHLFRKEFKRVRIFSYWLEQQTRPSVNYAKGWLDQSSSFLVLSSPAKGITLDVIDMGQSTTIFLCIGRFSAWWQPIERTHEQTNKRTNEQTYNPVILVQACSWLVRRQSFGKEHTP